MTRIVLDTNVFVSSFFGGNPLKVIDLWRTGSITLCLSESILEEYMRVLEELGLAGRPELQELLLLFSKGVNVVFTTTTPSLKIIEKDPSDNKFIECAVALSAKFVVSGDKHLLNLRQYFGIKILTPRQLLEMIPD